MEFKITSNEYGTYIVPTPLKRTIQTMSDYEMVDEFDAAVTTQPDIDVKHLALSIARKANYKSGKWCVYSYDIGKLIELSKELMEDGLVEQAKFSNNKNGEIPVFILYMTDFEDSEAIQEVGMALYTSQIEIDKDYYFKPDIYTTLGIYSQNIFGIKPGLYRFTINGHIINNLDNDIR